MPDLAPEYAASLFPQASPEERAELLMKAGRIPVDAVPYVIHHIRAAEAAMKDRCAKVAEEIVRHSGGHGAIATAIRNL